ncbi:hypothetical protein D1007_62494 [Hordeum vulgare]|nr:hypothetical protein D1007_62494 [Hordeum vulgare]
MTGPRALVVAERAAAAGGSNSDGLQAAVAGGSNKNKAAPTESSSKAAGGGEAVEDMMKRLNLTSKEATPLILDDEGDDEPHCPEWALIGKVLAPNTLHVNTITVVVRPAWGNLKGLVVRPMGPNMFLAEFGSEADKTRVAMGGPWYLGNKHAILLKDFDVSIKPEDVIFDRLPIWVRIMKLDYGLMNAERGTPLAARLGEVEQVEVDENGKAWGPFLRARVVIDPTQPIMRCVSVYSKKKDTTILFDVMYERLSMFCFSCGLLGHSSLVCPTPADRDSEGKLPYRGDKLCVPERKRRDAGSSNDQSQSSRNSRTGYEAGSGTQTSVPPKGQTPKADGQGEVISPLKKNPKGRKPIKPRKKTEKNNGKVVVTEDKDMVVGQKRKQKQVYRAINTTPAPVCTEGAGALVLVGDLLNPKSTPVLSDVASDDSNKKQRTTSS